MTSISTIGSLDGGDQWLTVHQAGEGALVVRVGELHQLLVDKIVVGQGLGGLAVEVLLHERGPRLLRQSGGVMLYNIWHTQADERREVGLETTSGRLCSLRWRRFVMKLVSHTLRSSTFFLLKAWGAGKGYNGQIFHYKLNKYLILWDTGSRYYPAHRWSSLDGKRSWHRSILLVKYRPCLCWVGLGKTIIFQGISSCSSGHHRDSFVWFVR